MQRSNPILFSSFLTAAVAAFGMLMFWDAPAADAGQTVSPSSAKYQALAPITHENLTIFPLIATNTDDTHSFLTLDEGLRSGEVVVTESGGASTARGHSQGDPGNRFRLWPGRTWENSRSREAGRQ